MGGLYLTRKIGDGFSRRHCGKSSAKPQLWLQETIAPSYHLLSTQTQCDLITVPCQKDSGGHEGFERCGFCIQDGKHYVNCCLKREGMASLEQTNNVHRGKKKKTKFALLIFFPSWTGPHPPLSQFTVLLFAMDEAYPSFSHVFDDLIKDQFPCPKAYRFSSLLFPMVRSWPHGHCFLWLSTPHMYAPFSSPPSPLSISSQNKNQ